MNRISYYLILIVGVALCLQSTAHAFMGYPVILELIQNGDIKEIVASDIRIIWVYSSVMMLMSGIWMLFVAKPVRNGEKRARLQACLLGVGLIGFGLFTSYVKNEVFNHLFFFTVEGLLLVAASTFLFRNHKVS